MYLSRSVVLVLLAAVLTGTLGCYRHVYTVNGFTAAEEAEREPWRHHLFFGLVPLSSDLDLRDACPEGVARVDNAIQPLNLLVTILTVGIYSPTTSAIYCRVETETEPDTEAEPETEAVGTPPAGTQPEVAVETEVDGGPEPEPEF